jgi:predicted O-methyltransferase YrrM
MLRQLRERARAKFARALQEFVVVPLRTDLDRTTSDLRRQLDDAREELRVLQSSVRAVESGLEGFERRQRRDMLTVTDQMAVRSAAEFQLREMPRVMPYFDKADTLAAALKAAPQEGLYLEFGVHTGGSLRTLVEHAPSGTVFGFDSFEGLPEDWRSQFVAGTFAVEDVPEVPGAEIVVGWFDQVLPGFLAEHPEEVAFLHLDADLYSSTKTVLDALESRLRAGTVVVFDEYFNFPGWQEHEHRAWTEFVERTGIRFDYLGFTADDEQISVRITEVPGSSRA